MSEINLEQSNSFEDKILEAISICVDSKLSKVKYDQTLTMTIRDDSKSSEGIYTVSNNSMTFDAKVRAGDTAHYSKTNKVYVLIPQGDYNQDKIILGRSSQNDKLDFTYQRRLDRIYDMIGPKNGYFTMPSNTTLTKSTSTLSLGMWNGSNQSLCSSFFDLFGFSVKVKTNNVNIDEAIDYGIRFYITSVDDKTNQQVYTFSAKEDMLGNIYKYIFPSEQEIVYRNTQNKCINIINAQAYYEVINEELFEELNQYDWSISFNDLRFYNGFEIEGTEIELIKIYDLDSSLYYQQNQKRLIRLLWVKRKDTSSPWVNGSEMVENYSITWQTQIPGSESAIWIDLDSDEDAFSKEINLYITRSYMKMRAQIIEQIDRIPRTKYSNEIEFINVTDVDFGKIDPANKINFVFSDGTDGLYALYGNNKELLNSADADVSRTITAVLSDGTQLNPYTSDYIAIWEYPKDGMITLEGTPTQKSNSLTYKIKPTLQEDTNNKITCKIVLADKIYYGEIDLSFRTPVWFSTPSTLVIYGLNPIQVSAVYSCGQKLTKYENIYIYARLIASDGTNITNQLTQQEPDLAYARWTLQTKDKMMTLTTPISRDIFYDNAGGYIMGHVRLERDNQTNPGTITVEVDWRGQKIKSTQGFEYSFDRFGQSIISPSYIRYDGRQFSTTDSLAIPFGSNISTNLPNGAITISPDGTSLVLNGSLTDIPDDAYLILQTPNGVRNIVLVKGQASNGQTEIEVPASEVSNSAVSQSVKIQNLKNDVIGYISQSNVKNYVKRPAVDKIDETEDETLRYSSYMSQVFECGGAESGDYLGTFEIKAKEVKMPNGTTTTSDRNKKHDISYNLDEYEKFYSSIRPVKYKYNDSLSNRYHTGFIAQDIKEGLEDNNLSTQDFAAYCEDKDGCGLRYEEFIALNTHMIQKLLNEVAELKQEIKEIKEERNG